MESPRRSFRWSPSTTEASSNGTDLVRRLADAADDRASSARALVEEASSRLLEWLATRPSTWTSEEARRELDAGLGAFLDAHRWRAVVRGWIESLEQVLARPRGRAPLRAWLAEELGLWLGGVDLAEDGEEWDGTALAPGRRLLAPDSVTPAALFGVERGEVIAVHGGSEPIFEALVAAARHGLAPRVVISEGGPELFGRALARRLALALGERGLDLRLVHDLALLQEVASADRLWVTTESIGAQAFAAPLGTRAVCEEARRREVRSIVPVTSDHVAPAGELGLPPWGPSAAWLLWHDPSERRAGRRAALGGRPARSRRPLRDRARASDRQRAVAPRPAHGPRRPRRNPRAAGPRPWRSPARPEPAPMTDAATEIPINPPTPRSIEREMKESYLTYALSVIHSRALPDVRDGLKPSQRRILVAMNDLNLGPRAKYRKCAKIAGDTSGNYHPHGESVIYPTLVRMAQDFSLRYPLVDGQGNFGSIDADPPAAMRYTRRA